MAGFNDIKKKYHIQEKETKTKTYTLDDGTKYKVNVLGTDEDKSRSSGRIRSERFENLINSKKNDVRNRPNYAEVSKRGRTNYESFISDKTDGLLGNWLSKTNAAKVWIPSWDKYTEEEKDLYGYLYETDKDKAREFMLLANEEHEKSERKKTTDKISKWAEDKPVLASAASLVANVGAPVDYIKNMGTAQAMEYYDGKANFIPSTGFSDVATAMQKGVQNKITENTDFEIAGANVAAQLYGIGMSVANSAALITAMGPLASVEMAMQAAASATMDAIDRGVTDAQAIQYGTAAGFAEAIFEYASIEKFFSLKDPKSIKQLLKFMAKQGGFEASEEVFTSVGNAISDAVINKDKSEYALNVESYLSKGMTQKEAETKASLDMAKGFLWDAIGGFISGGAMVGGRTAINKTIGKAVSEYNTYTTAKNPEAQKAILDYAMEAEEGSEGRKAAEDIKVKTEKGEAVSNREYAEVLKKANEDFETAEIKKQIKAEAMSTGEALTDEQIDAMSKSVLKTIKGKMISEQEDAQIEQSQSAKNVYARNTGRDYTYGERLSEKEARTLKESRDKQIISEYAEDQDEKYAKELTDAYVEYYAQNDDNRAMLDVESFAEMFGSFYEAGKAGFTSKALESYKNIDSNLKNAYAKAYEIGKADLEAENAAQIQFKRDATKRGVKGKIVFEGSARRMPKNKTQMAALEFLSRVLKNVSGIEYHIFASYVLDKDLSYTNKKGETVELKAGDRVYKDRNNEVIPAPNGFQEYSTRQIWVDLNAGKNGIGAMMDTIVHENIHDIRIWSTEHYEQLLEITQESVEAKGVSFDDVVMEMYDLYHNKKKHSDYTIDMAKEEVVAKTMSGLLRDENGLREFSQQVYAKDKTLWEKIKDWFVDVVARLTNAYKDVDLDSALAQNLKEQKELYEKAQKIFAEAVVQAGQNYKNFTNEFVQVDSKTQSVAPFMMYSERTWTQSKYIQEKEKTAEAIASELKVSFEEAKKYIDDINSVARLIADDRARLDYDPNLDEHATVLKPNSEYGVTVDMSTLCAKRLLFTGTFDAIQKRLPNTVFDSEDIVKLRKMMMDKHYEVACGICYVESTRREIGRITQEFIDRYKVAQKTGEPISRINSKGKEVVLTSNKKTFMAEKGYTPNLGELNTTDIDLVKRDHPEVYNAYLAFMNARGQSKPKLLETRAEYKGEILNHFKKEDTVKKKNLEGGLRLQSFSDFEVPHLIDMMQIVMDMSRVGLKSQAYTKVLNFAKAFGDTGIKINLSLIAKGNGLDADGNLIFDDVEGINHEEAFKLREKHSKNVGTILVGKNDAHIIAAMADPRIDMIIPFHKSSWKDSLYEALGLTGYTDYTSFQNERWTETGEKIKVGIYSDEYWDYSKTGDENAQIYLQKCQEEGRIPVFPQFQNYPGYWKLLIDFKMYDNDAVGAPHEVVKPIFNNEVNKQILADYKGGHKKFPVAQDIVDEFVLEYETGKMFDERDSDGNILSPEQVEFFKDSQVRDKKGRLLTLYHGSDRKVTAFDPQFSDDKTSLFFTSNYEVAHSYTRSDKLLNPYAYVDENSSIEDIAKVIEEARPYYSSVKAIDAAEAKAVVEEFKNKSSDIIDAMQGFLDASEGTNLGNSFFAQSIKSNLNDFKGWLKGEVTVSFNLLEKAGVYSTDLIQNIDKGPFKNPEAVKNALQRMADVIGPIYERFPMAQAYEEGGIIETTDKFGRKEYLAKSTALKRANYEQTGGILPVYANITNPLIIDAKGKRWNQIEVPPEMEGHTTKTELLTRDVAAFAHDNGYDGVIFKNLVDMAAVSKVRARKATVVVAFDGKQIKSVDNKTPTADPDIRYDDRDTEYMNALASGNIGKVEKLVEQAAKEAGYTEKLYHGTNRFGFTVPKTEGLEAGVEWSPFFATDSEEVARTYSGIGGTRWIADNTYSEENINRAYDVAEKEMTDAENELYFAVIRQFPYSLDFKDLSHFADLLTDELHMGKTSEEDIYMAIDEYLDLWRSWTHLKEDYGEFEDYEDFEDWEDSKEAEPIWHAIQRLELAIINYAKVRDMTGLEDIGNYGLYANPDNLFEIDAKGAYWNQIPFEQYDSNHKKINTRNLAAYARDNGYKGVKIFNVFDDGGRGPEQMRPATVFIFFDPQKQVKSADPVTKDDNGNVIPLSERFKKENQDLRYDERNSDYAFEGRKAVMTKARLDYLIADSGAGSRVDYAQAWITSISPTDYLNLTTDSKTQSREVFDKFGSEWDASVNMGNYDYLAQLGKSVRQTPYLAIDINTGEVVGHDGRHRIRALEKEGIKSVEIRVEFREDGRLVKYEPNGERWETLNGVRLTNQFGTGQKALIENVIPLNEDHRSEIEASYGKMSHNHTDIMYDEPDWKPDLDKEEWQIVNYVVENHQGKKLSPKTDYFFRTKNNKSVFGIYSKEDDVLLYAVHKKQAYNEYDFVKYWAEVTENDNISKRYAGGLRDWLEIVRMRYNKHINNSGKPAGAGGYQGNVVVYDRKHRFNPSAALQNVLNNIYQKEIVGEDLSYDERIETFDDQILALERQNKKLIKEMENLMRKYEVAQDRAKKNILAGQMAQGKKDAEQLRKTTEKYQGMVAARDQKLEQQSKDFKEALKAKDKESKLAQDYAMAEGVLAGQMAQGAEDAKVIREIEGLLQKKKAELKKVRERRDEILEEKRQAYAAYREKTRESIASGGLKKSIEKNAKTLYEWLMKNSDKEHVPEVLKTTVGDFLESIDFTSKRGLAGGETTKKDQAFAKKLNNLAAMLEKQRNYMNKANDSDAENPLDCFLDLPEGFAEEIRKLADDVAKIAIGGNFVVNEMNSAQLAQLNQALRVLKTSISKMNKLITNAHFASVTEAARSSMLEMAEFKEHKPQNDLSEQADKMLRWEMFTPVYAFKRYGKAGESIFKGIQKGWSDFAFAIDKVLKFTQETYTDKEVEAWEKETHSIKLSDGNTVTLTSAQLMSLYCLNKREQARGHIYGGGIRIADIKAGKAKLQQTEPYLVSFDDVETLLSELSERQIAVADKLQKFMTEQGSEWGNKVSMERFGYRAFTEDNYFPIESDDNNLIASNPEAKANDMFRLLNMSATKSLTKGANNAIVISDIFDIFSNHMSDMAKYGTLALPILDTMKWYNYKVRYDVGDGRFRTETVQKSVERAYGKAGKSYFTTFMKDLNGVKEGGRGEHWSRKMVSNYKIDSVGANIRVALLQPSSIVRASMEIEPKYILQALTKLPAAKKAESKSGVALWKALGFYNTDIARGVREQIKGGGKTIDKIRDKSMILAEQMDRITFGTLWNAAEAKAKDLGYSGNELEAKTVEIFDEIIYKTQVVDSTLTRSSLMRGGSAFTAAALAFMAEPTLSYNMVADTVFDMAKEKDFATGWKKQGKKFEKAIAVYAASSLAAAIIESIPDAIRDDDDEEWFGWKWWQAFWGEKFFDGNLVSEFNILEKIPFIKDLISLKKGYDVQRLDMAWATSAVKAYQINQELINVYIKGEKPTQTTYWGKMTGYGAAYANLRALSRIAGLPVSNAVRDVVAIWNTIVGGMAPSLKLKTYDDSKKK